MFLTRYLSSFLVRLALSDTAIFIEHATIRKADHVVFLSVHGQGLSMAGH